MQPELTFRAVPFEGRRGFYEFAGGETELSKTSKPAGKFNACKIVPITLASVNSLKPPSVRQCCMLAPTTNPLIPDERLIHPSALGKHRSVIKIAGISSPGEAQGIVYTGKAGFLDLAHMRDLCDLTKFVFDQLSYVNGTPEYVRTVHGYARIHKCPADVIKVARSISFDDSIGYEIGTYFKTKVGRHNSSFSPEDLCSNFLGTLLAEMAISISRRAKVNFNRAVDAALRVLLKQLDVLPKSETRKAFDLINGRWVAYNGVPSLLSALYLQRRNFSQVPFKAGHPADKPTPAFVTTPLPDYSSVYSYVHWEEGQTPLLKRCRSAKDKCFASEISRIRKISESLYGANFDKP